MAVLPEPTQDVDGEATNMGEWLRTSLAPEAVAARGLVNEWYATFQDRDGMVASRLSSGSDDALLQALDELYVFHLLSSTCEVRYEEGEGSPDYRVYRSDEYLA